MNLCSPKHWLGTTSLLKLLHNLKFICGVFLSKIVSYIKLFFFKHIKKHIIRRAVASIFTPEAIVAKAEGCGGKLKKKSKIEQT